MHEMTVYGVSFDLVGKQPIVLLRAAEGPMYLPIWIGHTEAAAILMRLQGQEPPRPLTHDLALSLVESLGAEVAYGGRGWTTMRDPVGSTYCVTDRVPAYDLPSGRSS